MKTAALILSIILLPTVCWGQDDDFGQYVREQQADFARYVKETSDDFKAYNDSINREFAQFLAETWPDYKLQKVEPPIKTPQPPAVYRPDTYPTEPLKLPVRDIVPLPDPTVTLPDLPRDEKEDAHEEVTPTPPPTVEEEIKTLFYGTTIGLKKATYSLPRLAGIDERAVSAYWSALSQLPYTDWAIGVQRLRSSLKLNEWGLYLLVNHVFDTYFPGRSASEQTVFAVFTLNQLGYRARIGRAEGQLMPLLAFDCGVSNSAYFEYSGIKYYIVNLDHVNLTSVQSCRMDYGGADRLIRMALTTAPKLQPAITTRTLKTAKGEYTLQYDSNYARLLSTYPCVDFHIYAQAAPSEAFLQSVDNTLRPALQGKSQEAAVNLLLDMIQNGFKYMTDGKQFGYEHWNFPDETMASAYCDCEDRAILFSHLVRHLLGMDVVLIYYPGQHLAAAVHFDNPATRGDYVTVDGKKYLICDPTFIGASLGMAMPDLKSTTVEVVTLK